MFECGIVECGIGALEGKEVQFMKAMILAAGLGTRLRPLTDQRPKPLLPIVLSPILDHILRQLQQVQVDEVVINLHHQAEQLRQWLGDGSRWNLRIHPSHEVEILGTAGALKHAAVWLEDDPFWLINADVLADYDLPAIWQSHRERDAMVTMVVRPDPAARQYGAVIVDADDRVRKIAGRPPLVASVSGDETMFAGAQVVSPRVLDWIESEQFVTTTGDIYPELIAAGERVLGYRHIGYWMDVGVPERYLQAHWDLMGGALGMDWVTALPAGTQVVLDPDSTSGMDGVKLEPPVVIGPGVEFAADAQVGPYAVIGPDCRVGSGAVIRESVLWDGVVIGEKAEIQRSILGRGVAVEQGQHVFDTVLCV